MITPDEKSRLLHSVADAIHEREVPEALAAICESICPSVDVDAVGVVRLVAGRVQPHEIHVRGVPRAGSASVWEMLATYLGTSDAKLESMASAIYEDPRAGIASLLRDGVTQVVNLELERRFPEDQMLYEHGVRSYVRTALVEKGQTGGVLEFYRLQHGAPAVPFSAEEAEFLAEVSAAIAGSLRAG